MTIICLMRCHRHGDVNPPRKYTRCHWRCRQAHRSSRARRRCSRRALPGNANSPGTLPSLAETAAIRNRLEIRPDRDLLTAGSKSPDRDRKSHQRVNAAPRLSWRFQDANVQWYMATR